MSGRDLEAKIWDLVERYPEGIGFVLGWMLLSPAVQTLVRLALR